MVVKNQMKIFHILKATVVLAGLGVFLFVFTIFLPFIVQERFVMFLIISVLLLTFFHSKISSDQDVIYKINIEESE